MAIFVACGLVAGCGGGGGDSGGGGTPSTLRCIFADDYCGQITAVMSSAQQTQLASDCTGVDGSYAEGECPTAGAVPGYCSYTGAAFTIYTGYNIPGATLQEYFYTAGAWTLQDAQAWCSADPAGTWVP